MSVIGDFDDKEIAKLMTDLFGDWKSPKPFVRVPTLFQDIAPVNQSLPAPDKANAFFLAGFNVKMRDDNPDYPALLLGQLHAGWRFPEFTAGVAHPAERKA